MSATWERWFALTPEQRLFIIHEHFDKIDKQHVELEILREMFKIQAAMAEKRTQCSE